MNTTALSWALPTAPGLTVTLAEGDTEERPHLTGLAVPFGVPSNPSQDGHRYQFNGPPSNADDLIDVVFEHDDDALVGRLAEEWGSTEAGLTARARIFNTTRGRDVLEEAREGARTGFSVAAVIEDFDERDGVRHVTDWTAAHLGAVRRPAFPTAGFTIAASAQKEPDMPEHNTTTDPGAGEATGSNVLELPTIADLAAQVAEHLDIDSSTAHPLAEFSTQPEFYAAFQAAHETGDTERANTLKAAFAVPDQITSDNPGLMPPQWRTDIKKRIDKRTPAMRAFGTIGLPGTGMDVSWPYLDPALDIDAIIQQQLAEKAELTGVAISILKDSQTIKTAGAVSDISYQLLMRSSPSYLGAHNEILLAAWARYLEAKFTAQLLAKGTDSALAAPTTVADLKARLFEASADVEDATGSPADVVLVSSDLWKLYGADPDLKSPEYGTQNVPGTGSARSLRININGLEVERAPFLTASTLVVASSDAAKASNSGAQIATAEDVRKLGRDVAVWGLYTDGEVYFPNGVIVDNGV